MSKHRLPHNKNAQTPSSGILLSHCYGPKYLRTVGGVFLVNTGDCCVVISNQAFFGRPWKIEKVELVAFLTRSVF